MILRHFLVGVMAVIPIGATAQVCLSSVDESTPTADFTDNQDGTVTHKTTGLTWLRCPVGQTFNATNEACEGPTTGVVWKDALAKAESFSFAGFDDWRLPNPKELTSILEFSCATPAINLEIFPHTGTAYFWTSSPLQTGSLEDRAWAVRFSPVATQAREKNMAYPIYLIR